ncbi:hypothetical protein RchiOBHm_Chr5g0056691 [Rosa chinensis]|uniref:Uncharacterized protein n=1 Tax=Rosa chinensis TaxID=74649 RepID=A0A2P6QGR0_ROSCH|nr:hypothetical protein RchiOBHm_Chr5g0056691 [Rosa chinensis]
MMEVALGLDRWNDGFAATLCFDDDDGCPIGMVRRRCKRRGCWSVYGLLIHL